MSKLNQLQPEALWQWFEQICAIPHPSKHESALSTFIQQWAKEKNLSVTEDNVGNLIIRKPATKGMEDRKIVAIQAHMDMVPQKNADKVHDFEKDPIETYIDGEWVKAKGTTLGADNGIGMASALALLSSDNISHGPLEILLTIDEEAGMTGAFGLEAGYLEADILINTDSEQEGEIYMGCAGGADARMTLPIERMTPKINTAFIISVNGLKGGHSGVNIHLGRANANKVLGRFLFDINQQHADLVCLSDFHGGTLRNAIPREASCTVICDNKELLQHEIDQFQIVLQNELASSDPDVCISMLETSLPDTQLSPSCSTQLIQLINACPNGVIRMSDEIEDVVETSLNLGVISTQDNQITLLCLIRSLIDSGRQQVEGSLSSLASLAGANISFSGKYPGWKPDPTSPIMKIFSDVYQDMYHKDPAIMVIHAGLECGLFKQPYPDMDMASVGPTIRFPHSPDEMVNIESVNQYWQLLLAVLTRIPTNA